MLAATGSIGPPNASAIGPDGTFYYTETYAPAIMTLNRMAKPVLLASAAGLDLDSFWSSVRQVKPPFPLVSETESIIASEDGSEVYVFDMYGKHMRTLNALTGGVLYAFTYDSLGFLTGVKDRDGLTTHIQRDAAGVPVALVSPYGQRTLLGIDGSGYLTHIINPAGDTTRFTYTPDGLMTSLTDPRGNTHSFAYDSLGRLRQDIDPAGGYKALTRENRPHGYAVSISTALGDKSTYAVERLPDGSQLMTTTDASGLTDTTIYKLDGTWTTISHDGTITATTQGPDPRFGMQSPITADRKVSTPSGYSNSETTESRTVSEMVGLQVGQLIDDVTINGYRTYETTFDGTQRLFSTLSPEARQSFTYIDKLGRVLSDSIPGIVPVNYSYDAKGRLSSVAQGTRVSYFTYDSLGRIAVATDPAGHTSGFAYDSVGRVTVQTLPDGRVITFTYDPNGNLIALTPPGRPEHIFDYNVNDLTVRYTPPQVGDTSNLEPGTPNPEPRTTNYSYDLDKRLVTTSLPDGRNITITYDTSSCGCGGTASRIHSMTYDRGTQTFAYDSAGNLSLSVTPEHDSLGYVYDGFIPWATIVSGAVKGIVVYDIDENYELKDIALIEGNQWYPHNSVGYDYDGDGLLTGIYQPIDSNWNEDQNHYMSINRDFQTGNITSTSLGSVSTEQTYDSYGGLASYEADYGSTPMFQTTYSRDSLGRITSIYETEFGVSKNTDYEYDPVGRLTKVWRNDTLVSQYVYDANGNRVVHITPTSIDSGTYDAQDRMLKYGNVLYLYSANGDLRYKIQDSDTTSYSYDAFGNLTQVVMPNGDVIQYVIDGQNRRIARKLNGRITNKWLYARLDLPASAERAGQLTPVAELDSADNIIARFSGGYMNKRDTIYQIIRDHLGSVRLVVNILTGNVVQRIDYDEFGNVVFDSNPGFQPFGFANGLRDITTRLTRFGARDYDAEVGRWTHRDPIGFNGGSVNLYEYMPNDPVNFVDVFGQDAIRVIYSGYMIDTGFGFHLPLGHAAVVAVDPGTGSTRYYEYGRYGGDFGRVMRRWVPDLKIDCNGSPTKESLQKFYDYISQHYGKGRPVDANYYQDADYQSVVDYAEQVMNNPRRPAYSIWSNNCYTFSQAAVNAGLGKKK